MADMIISTRLSPILLCDQVQQTPDGKKVLVGIFDGLHGNLPLRHQMMLYAKAELAAGEHKMVLYVWAEGKARPPGGVGMKVTARENGKIEIVLPLRVVFDAEGDWRFELEEEGVSLGATTIKVEAKTILLTAGAGELRKIQRNGGH